MTTFFTILFIILGVNLVMMFFSLTGLKQKAKKSLSNVSDVSISKIHSLDLISSKYKKAV
jgi:hypothetical protein